MTLKSWAFVHKWTSLVCTIFLLLLCLTGLPLIFHHEIDDLTGHAIKPADLPPDTPLASLDKILAAAQAVRPDYQVQYMFWERDEPLEVGVNMGPTPTATENTHSVVLDARTAQVLQQGRNDEGFMHIMFELHVDLFAGLPGKLFLGAMGILFSIAVISGVVLYGPFMRRLAFGSVRRNRSSRLKWLDLHNLLGIVTLAWALVVGITGIINTWADLVVKHWQEDQLASLLAPYRGQAPIEGGRRAPFEQTFEAALARTPGMRLAFVAFPGTAFSSAHHDTFFMRGNTPLTSSLLQPVLVDARTGEASAAPPLQHWGSLQAAVDSARQALPALTPSFVAFPGTPFTSEHHYGVFMRGKTPLTARLVQPALIDVQTAQLTDTRPLPWYVTALLVSQPLHFGDYGGMPLKIIWAVLDLITIVVLASGIYLWLVRRKRAFAVDDPEWRDAMAVVDTLAPAPRSR